MHRAFVVVLVIIPFFNIMPNVIADFNGIWSSQNCGDQTILRGVTFLNFQKGWAVGNDGTILTTSNGGQDWTNLPSGTDTDFYEVSFVDSLHGWTCGYRPPSLGGYVYATSDGGLTWINQFYDANAIFLDITFVDSSNGWVVGQGGIWATSNGGATWSKQYGDSTTYVVGVCFIDTLHGWAVGKEGSPTHSLILATSDGGITWEEQGEHILFEGFPVQLEDVVFIDLLNGWIVGRYGTILATSDGGSTWIRTTSDPVKHLRAISFVDLVHGWAFGDEIILETSDGGINWSKQWFFGDLAFRDGFFVDSAHGWAVGWIGHGEGKILSYSNDPSVSDVSSYIINSDQDSVYFVYPDYTGVKPSGVGYAWVSDWSAMGFIIGMCSNRQYEVTDTDSSIIDPISGAVRLEGQTIATFGGSDVNALVNYYEKNRIAPIYWQNDGGTWYCYEADGTRLDQTAVQSSELKVDANQDIFVVEYFIDDSGNRVLIIYGYTWKGTMAGGKFLKFIMYPDISSYTDSYYIYEWVDGDGDGFVDLDEISTTPIASG